ncbi:MAG: shikimate kinase [Acidimicrobiia bacterium]|nr:shikimate kinase [Acidimicrobiia bacterium]
MRALWLIGMMGSGKTVVGATIARQIGVAFVDTDDRIAAELGQTITTIWDDAGEAGFRDLEADQIARLIRSGEDCVVATGGGAVLRPANVEAMRSNGLVVWLTAGVEILATRLGDDLTRPLLTGGSVEGRLAELLAERLPLYADAAHHTVNTTNQHPQEVAREVIRLWNAS